MIQKEVKSLETVLTEEVFIVDVRSPEEFQTGSAADAVNIPLHTVPVRINEFENKENIVVFCESGGRSEQAKMFLEQNGIENIINGGGWRDVCCAQETIENNQ